MAKLSIKTKHTSLMSMFIFLLFGLSPCFGSEADLIVPDLSQNPFAYLLYAGIGVCVLGLIFGLFQYIQTKKLGAYSKMLEVSELIFETCKTYLIQQGKFLIVLEIIIGVCIAFYFGYLQHMPASNVLLILLWSVIGILGSYGVAWFGIRINTFANSRMAFASLRKSPVDLLRIPLQAGMSIGVVLVSVELLLMLVILLFMPSELSGACFIGFAIGESLGASALRICGGIFTKIADIGSDLMKIVFNIKEDDPRNPGVIADCTGDNAGDSVGPTADGFETYGVTGVALVSFILLGVFPQFQSTLIIWIFVMRILMILTSIFAYQINDVISKALYGKKDMIDFEVPLTRIVWITSILSIVVTFAISYILLKDLPGNIWLVLSGIISCGTLGAALIPELTKVFTSPKSKHTKEVVTSSREGGASLTVLSGFVAGNFSAFWIGMTFFGLMLAAYLASLSGLSAFMEYPSIFAFGLVAFGFLGMGPVTIAVDSYGPVADNAQSVYELSLIEEDKNAPAEIQKKFGFKPDYELAKHYLEANDSAGNTFKATAKPVLIGTAVVGASTMIFSLILVIKKTLGVEPEMILNLLNPYTMLGFICGGAVIYWFTGAATQAVTAGSYKTVEFIKKNIDLEKSTGKASVANSKEVVKICTQFAQRGMVNIFGAIMAFTLSFAMLSAPQSSNAPVAFFVSYLIAIAIIGLYQAVFMANAGGCWDNAKKIVEVDLKEKGTPLHAATVVGDTVGDPFKDTSSVALNPIIKFTTLFGLLAMEIAISGVIGKFAPYLGFGFMLIGFFFVYRSFYNMRVPTNRLTAAGPKVVEEKKIETVSV
jgi:K(+)-stimulated pyrophosphate-energized sodium pump